MTEPARCRGCDRSRRPTAFTALAVMALATMAVARQAQAGADCSITSVGLNFGLYDLASVQPDDVAATVAVTCVYVAPGATNVSYTLAFSSGLYGTDAMNRRLGSGAGRLEYNVFTDSGRSRVWGTGSGGTVVASGSMTVGPGVGNGTRTATHTVYGRMPALQDAPPGDYLDSLVVTLTW